MPERVPVADSLLTTKFKGFSVKRLLQSFAIPLGPAVIALLLNLPLRIYGPLGIAGAIIGGTVFAKTPACQRPHHWLLGMLKIRFTDATYHWHPSRSEEASATYESYWHSTDEMKTRTDGGEHVPEDEQTEIERLLASDETTDHLDFEHIRSDGVVVTDEGVSMLIEIGPRPWLILDDDQKEAVLEAWRDILMGTQSTFQILTLPTPYDASEYTRRLEDANRTRDYDEHPLLSHGRAQHRNWVDNIVNMADIRDRQHFIVVTVKKSVADDTDEDDGPLSQLRRSDDEDVDIDLLAREVRSRAENMASSLPPTGVDPEILDDPDEIKKVLYYDYKGTEPPETLDHGWLTKHARPEDVQKGAAQRPTQTNTHQPNE